MSLDAPTYLDKAIAKIKAFAYLKPLLIGIGLLIVLGLVLFSFDACGDWRDNRGNEKLKANINAALSDITAKEQTIANIKTEIAVEKERVQVATEQLLQNTFTTDEKRAETNKALANLAVAANAPAVNASVLDLEKALRGLE